LGENTPTDVRRQEWDEPTGQSNWSGSVHRSLDRKKVGHHHAKKKEKEGDVSRGGSLCRGTKNQLRGGHPKRERESIKQLSRGRGWGPRKRGEHIRWEKKTRVVVATKVGKSGDQRKVCGRPDEVRWGVPKKKVGGEAGKPPRVGAKSYESAP